MSTRPESNDMNGRGRHCPVVIIAFVVGGAGVNLALMLVATRDASFAVEADYYQKALRWDQTMAQEAENTALGWSVAMTLDRSRPDGTRVRALVADREGQPVEGARVGIEAFHSARASRVIIATLEAEPSGGYSATLPLERPGLWEMRVRVERGEQVFTHTLEQILARMP